VVAPQALWSRWVRVNPIPLFVVTCFAQLGMWMERFMLIVSSEEQDFLPSSWNVYHPSIIDFSILFGTISFFLFLFLLFLRFFPFIPISDLLLMRFEMRQEEREERAASRPATDGPRAGEGGDDAGDLR
jgi:molybdopterin-containing oxidoreductase family membrane subunit